MRKIELLAPARDLATGIDAVNCGADAVYIGAEEFGARRNANNPSSEIGKLAAYAHRYGVRVYVTVNRPLTDEELPRARALLRRVWNAGADAAIVTDMGLLEGSLPPMPLISSVMAQTDTPEKALFLERAGVKRITLPRSISLETIKRIRAATSVEIECFVHGGCCVRVSNFGQCYLDYALGGPPDCGCRGSRYCRRLYTLKDASDKILARDKYLLSMKELDLSRRLGALLDAGVDGFKINGRQESRAFVRNSVAYYRAALDKALKERGLARTSHGRSFVPFKPDPAKIPNTGFREFFTNSREQEISCPDILKFPGSAAFADEVMSAVPERKLGVKLEFRRSAAGLKLKAVAETGNSAEVFLSAAKAVSVGPALAASAVKVRLSAAVPGFYASGIRAALSARSPVSAAALAKLMKSAFSALGAAIDADYKREKRVLKKNRFPYPEKELAYTANILNSEALRFYKRHGVVKAGLLTDIGRAPAGKLLLSSRFCLRPRLGLCPRQGGAGRNKAGAGNAGPLFLETEGKRLFRLEFDCRACRMNMFLAKN